MTVLPEHEVPGPQSRTAGLEDAALHPIDAHIHVLPSAAGWERERLVAEDPWFATCHAHDERILTVPELQTSLGDALDERVVCMTWPFADAGRCVEGTEVLLNELHGDDRIRVAGMVNPRSPAAATVVDNFAHRGVCALGELNADAQGWTDHLDELAPVLEAAAAHDLPVVLHTSDPVGHRYPGKGTMHTEQLASVVRILPSNLRLILAHGGGGFPWYVQMPEFATVRAQLYCDLAAMPWLYEPSVLPLMIRSLGSSHLLYATDAPRFGRRRTQDWLAAAELSVEEYRDILERTAASLFHWEFEVSNHLG